MDWGLLVCQKRDQVAKIKRHSSRRSVAVTDATEAKDDDVELADIQVRSRVKKVTDVEGGPTDIIAQAREGSAEEVENAPGAFDANAVISHANMRAVEESVPLDWGDDASPIERPVALDGDDGGDDGETSRFVDVSDEEDTRGSCLICGYRAKLR